jgi:transcriptional regulator with XRE-family HTH domain
MAKHLVDTAKLYAMLDRQRSARGMSWRQLAKEAGVNPSMLSRLRNGSNPDTDGFASLVGWLGADANDFFTSTDPAETSAPLPEVDAQILVMLRSRGDLSDADIDQLTTIISSATRLVVGKREER